MNTNIKFSGGPLDPTKKPKRYVLVVVTNLGRQTAKDQSDPTMEHGCYELVEGVYVWKGREG